MDVGRILGGMLANRSGRAPGNGRILGEVLNGVAQITAAANQGQRFPHSHHQHFEHMVRDSISRHHHHGGPVPHPAQTWVGQQRSVRVPAPQHDHSTHHSGWNHNQRAELLITAMVMAAQADGRLDQTEQDKIIQNLQPLDANESQFLRQEFGKRHDVDEFVRAIPNGMEYEVYSISLMVIHLDTRSEAQYLRTLAECMRLNPQEVNHIHTRYGAPLL